MVDNQRFKAFLLFTQVFFELVGFNFVVLLKIIFSMYSEEEKNIMKSRILEEMTVNRRSLDDILLNDVLGEFPSVDTVYKWRNPNHKHFDPEFAEDYERARELRAEIMFSEINALSDEADTATYIDPQGNKRIDWGKVNRNKLQIDARKWTLSRMFPKKYGDKLETTLQGGENPIKTVDVKQLSNETLEELAKQADANKPKP